jgi:hypothetical protein
VDTAVAPVPVAGAPVAGAVDDTVADATNGLTTTVQGAAGALSGKQQPSPQRPPDGGSPQTGPSGGTPGNQSGGAPAGIPAPTSPVLGGAPATFDLLPAYAPMRDYSNIPYALAGLFAPSPGLRYGGQIPGYAPQLGTLDPGPKPGAEEQQAKPVQNAGQAEAMPGDRSGRRVPTGLPMLIAVLALSGVSAALVRAWVLRGATP